MTNSGDYSQNSNSKFALISYRKNGFWTVSHGSCPFYSIAHAWSITYYSFALRQQIIMNSCHFCLYVIFLTNNWYHWHLLVVYKRGACVRHISSVLPGIKLLESAKLTSMYHQIAQPLSCMVPISINEKSGNYSFTSLFLLEVWNWQFSRVHCCSSFYTWLLCDPFLANVFIFIIWRGYSPVWEAGSDDFKIDMTNVSHFKYSSVPPRAVCKIFLCPRCCQIL